ncbi:MAG: response regulator transcription factor [Gammaproteobacteria bacterium]|nr:response regulator transcription factor [Gammaproteobacteria bacterium]
MARIALLEDDLDQAALVNLWLTADGHQCQAYHSGADFIKALSRESFDMLIIDWVLPDLPGDKVLEWVRERVDWHIPVIFTTGRSDESDVVLALQKGADDYMIKPLRQAELIARIRALNRRSHALGTEPANVLDFPPYQFQPRQRLLTLNGTTVTLTQKQYDLALFLFNHVGRIMSRGHLLESVWGVTPDLNTRTVDIHISRLRKKLELDARHGWQLNTVYQHGYRLENTAS